MTDTMAFMDAGPADRGGEARLAPRPALRFSRSSESRQFWLIYALTFPGFFLAALVMRLIRLGAPHRMDTRRTSLLREANELASASIPYAFMG